MMGIMFTYTNLSRGDFVWGDIVSIPASQVLVSLCICSGSSDTLLLNNTINETIPCAAVRVMNVKTNSGLQEQVTHW